MVLGLARNPAKSDPLKLIIALYIARMRSRHGICLRNSERWETDLNNASMLYANRLSNMTTTVPFGSLLIQGRSSSLKTVSQVL